jgi:hypothetical protein
MRDNTPPRRTVRSPRAHLLAAAGLASAVLVAGCGGSSAGSTVAAVSSTTTSTSQAAGTGAANTSKSNATTRNSAASSGPATQAGLQADELAYAKCMRANGVPTFPDPRAGGGFNIPRGAGIDMGSPTFKAAQTKCQKLVPGLGGGPGSGPPPSAEAMAKMLTVAECMRRQGVSNFPEPRATLPSDPLAAMGGSGVISDIDGVILLFPSTIDQQSPLFTRAAAVCAFPLHNH